MDRTILHCDCNCFYASVEEVYDPSLKGKPVAVAGEIELRHGIILTKNYIASKYGIKTGETIWLAKQKCPELILIKPHFDRYIKFCRATREIYRDFSDYVEPFGLDEAWLDVTGFGSGFVIAKEISERVKNELGITLSIGVSYNKIFAKFGSDYKKPDAITQITRDNFKDIVWPCPVSDLLYVGRATAAELNRMGIKKIGQLAKEPLFILKNHFGKNGEMLFNYANGEDNSPVAKWGEDNPVKSIGNSTTPPADMKTLDEARLMLLKLTYSVAERLREGKLKCKCVSVSKRDSEFLHTTSCQRHLRFHTDLTRDIYQTACDLLLESNFKPLRSIGISVSDLTDTDTPEQLAFFEDYSQKEKLRRLDKVTDYLHKKFGASSITSASIFADSELISFNPKEEHFRIDGKNI